MGDVVLSDKEKLLKFIEKSMKKSIELENDKEWGADYKHAPSFREGLKHVRRFIKRNM